MKFKASMAGIAGIFMIATVCLADTNSNRLLPSAVLPDGFFMFSEVVEGTEVLHEFRLLNKGAGPLNIVKVETS